jgi:predicted GNAT superfamily acetyltransferase
MIVIRSCSGHDELEACVQMQIETWGYDDSDVIPRKAFLVGQRIGGQVIGAFDTELPGAGPNGTPESMIGFAMSLPGIKTGRNSTTGNPQPYLHSHMLAVRDNYRNRGLGARLKLEQRREALERGIRRMEWTFDPLEIRNAHLNIHKLGAVVRSYFVNFYGVSSSRLQGGLPTDRLIAEWYLASDRVNEILEGRHAPDYKIEERIMVPAAIYEWKASPRGREQALAVQAENRKKFQDAFSKGLAVVSFTRDEEGNGVFELGSWSQPALV